jgi:hypothetical protein
MLDTIIALVARIDVALYFLCGLGILLGFRSLSLSRQLKREALFGLEREAARRLRSRALSTIGSMIALAGSVYVVTNVVKPTLEGIPVASRGEVTATPEVTLPPNMTATLRPLLFPTVTPTFGIIAAEGEGDGPPSTPKSDGSIGCELIGATITNPIPGEVVAGQVEVRGEANILNFLSYKFEINGPSTDDAWATIGTFTTPVASGFLGTWDSTSLQPGSYQFRLVVVDVEGSSPEPCVIPLTIAEQGLQPATTGTPAAP